MATATRKLKVMTPTENKVRTDVAKKKVFDLEKFEKVSKEVEYNIPEPLTSLDDVISMNQEQVLAWVNAGRERAAWKEARQSIQGVSPKIINQFVNVWRMLPPYSEMVTLENGKATKESRQKQTQAIYAFIKSQESILNSLKLAAANASPDEDEDEDEEES